MIEFVIFLLSFVVGAFVATVTTLLLVVTRQGVELNFAYSRKEDDSGV